MVFQINVKRRSKTTRFLLTIPFDSITHNLYRARKSRRTLQNKVRIKVFPEQLTLFINTCVALKQCIIQ